MPYQITWDTYVVTKRHWGFLTGAEFATSAQQMAGDPRFDRLQFILADYLLVDGFDLGGDAMESIAVTRFGSMPSNPHLQVVVVARDDLAKMLGASLSEAPLVGSQRTHFFAAMALAREWMVVQERPVNFGPRRL